MELLSDRRGVEATVIITRTPLRISLVGGGTDMPAFTQKHPGAVVSFAIDKYVYVSVNPKFDRKFRVSYSKTENADRVDQIKHDLVRESLKISGVTEGVEITSISDIPGTGTGLGSSSAFTVGLLKALEKYPDPSILAERAFEVESGKCYHPVGRQDQYASAHGGFNFMIFGKNNVQVTPLRLPFHWRKEFSNYALLLWTGITRDANDILQRQDKTFRDGGNIEIGKHLSRYAHDFYQELIDGANMERLGALMNIAWTEKKMLAPGISTMKIDDLYGSAIKCGAYGGKLLGAGGGGFLFFLAPPEKHDDIVEKTGLKKIDFKIEMEGSKVIYNG